MSKKKRSKKYRSRQIKVPMIVGNVSVFAAPLKLLHDIRHGYVDEYRGKILLPTVDRSEAYYACEVLMLFSEFINRVTGDDTSCIIRLANRLKSDMPVTGDLLTDVDVVFARGYAESAKLTGSQALSILSRCGDENSHNSR